MFTARYPGKIPVRVSPALFLLLSDGMEIVGIKRLPFERVVVIFRYPCSADEGNQKLIRVSCDFVF